MKKTPIDAYESLRLYIGDVSNHCEIFGTNGRYYRVIGDMRRRNLQGLCSVGDVDWSSVTSPFEAAVTLQIPAFFKKNESLEDEVVTTSTAIDSFHRSERRCRIVNRRLDYYYSRPERLAPDLEVLIARAVEFIDRCLGDSSIFLEELPTRISVTSGASAGHSRRESIPFLKLRKRIEVPSRAMKYSRVLARFLGYDPRLFKVCDTNRVEFVPKSFKTRRTIACEPSGGLPFQLAVDSFVKDRLRRFGINLSSQTLNQKLALQGSVDGSYATIDLEAASDSVALNTVHWLFPDKWAKILNDFRSPFGRIGRSGKPFQYAKFASMGNGSTFVVETLIFAAFCWATGSRDHAVYGDDIVIRDEYVASLSTLLRFFGFRINKEKSFTSGPFRESCGVHAFNGVDVTPFYYRRDPTHSAELCHFVNGMAHLGFLGKIWDRLAVLIREYRLPLVPPSEDTRCGVWITATDAYKLRLLRYDKNLQCPTFRGLIPVPRRVLCDPKDSRSLFLWYLGASKRHIDATDAWVKQADRYPISDFKYKRRRLIWTEPAAGGSSNLFWWSNYISERAV